MASRVKDLGALPHWDLSNVYPGLESDEFSAAVVETKSMLDDLEAYLAERQIARLPPDSRAAKDAAAVKAAIDGYLDRMNAIQRQYATLRAYIWSFVTTDSYNTTAKRLLSELEMQGVRLQQAGVRFQAWIGSVEGALPHSICT